MTTFLLMRSGYINGALQSPGVYTMPQSQALLMFSMGYGVILQQQEASHG